MTNKTLGLMTALTALALACPAFAGETAEGTVGSTGIGSFKLIDATGTAREFNLAKKTTKYEPAEWRPATGDKISVAYTEITKGNDKVLRVDTVTLTKAGPETVLFTSPVEVVLTEVGKSGVRGKVGAEGKIVKFDRTRDTQLDPTGWVPAPGEKTKIEFQAKESTFAFGVTYVITKMSKITDAAPAAK